MPDAAFPKLLVLILLLVTILFPSYAQAKEKKRFKVTAPAPTGKRLIPHNYTDIFSPFGRAFGCMFKQVDHNNYICLAEQPGYAKQQRFLGEVIFDADDTCYRQDPLGGPTMEDRQYLKLLDLSDGGWGGVGKGPAPTDSCGPTYTAIICFQHNLVKRVLKDRYFQKDTIQVCQEGFNTGREAYVWLNADPAVKLVAFDHSSSFIGSEVAKYLRPAADFLTEKFGASRFELVTGNDTYALMPSFMSSHPNFPGCDIVSLTGTAPSPEIRHKAITSFRRIVNARHFIVSDNSGCSSGFCSNPSKGLTREECRIPRLYAEFKVSFHEALHRARHNGASKIVNAPLICGFLVHIYNMSIPSVEVPREPCK